MPKLQTAYMKYIVSFNCDIDQGFGDCDMNTIDYQGDNVEDLAEEVINSDPTFPMIFIRNDDLQDPVIGWFAEVNDNDYLVAIMVTRTSF